MVDKIVGPGNAYVAEAKRQVFGQVGIDLIAGPSEVLVIADNGSDARIVAADMLSQAEHDRMATAVLITTDQFVAERTAEQLEMQLVTEAGDVAAYQTPEAVTLAPGKEEIVTLTLFTGAKPPLRRDLVITYYLWGRLYTMRYTLS